jgi:hypothetical protein
MGNTGEPLGTFLVPVFDSFDASQQMVGILTTLFVWGDYFQGSLSFDSTGEIICVLENSSGDTCSIISNIEEVKRYLEYCLCYHTFCHYSHNLENEMRNDLPAIEFGSRNIVRYYNFNIFRGDNGCDGRTPKMHAQIRTGINYRRIGHLMNASCHVGERLLRTEAKGVSSTAQKRGAENFTYQTGLRLEDRSPLDKFAQKTNNTKESNTISEPDHDKFTRKQPHVQFSADDDVYTTNRKGKRRNQDFESGYFPEQPRTALKAQEKEQGNFRVFNEAKLRSGALVRAFPNYRREGPWYDWVNIVWVDSHGENVFLPAKTLCFYESDKAGMCALVHSTVVQRNQSHDSMLSCSYEMEYTGLKPTITKVEIGSIDRSLLVYEHVPTKECLPPHLEGFSCAPHCNSVP